MLRKDLTLSRLTNFDDLPEHYQTWRVSFESVAKEFKLSSFEEMDLLVKYLGPVSSNFASSIRASNVNNPERGVSKIWERLDDRYGQPEMLESSLKKRLYRFPKLTDSDYQKLYELSDLLSEIESVKENPKYAALLSYFDTSAGVIPIVRKLPGSIQGKWITRASRYKQEKNVAFPPFAFFVSFIGEMSKMLNDPGLVYEEHTPRKNTNPSKSANQDKVSVRKSKVFNQGEENDPEKFCPLHKSAKHPLTKCKGFRSSTLEEKRKVLKENNICFKCCKSSAHIARACPEDIVCTLCGSKKHATPMHVNTDSDKAALPQGGESGAIEDVSAKCTQICGEGFTGRSCS